MESFQVTIDTRIIQVRHLGNELYRISFMEIDLGNILKTVADGSSTWISTTGLRMDLVKKLGNAIDLYNKAIDI